MVPGTYEDIIIKYLYFRKLPHVVSTVEINTVKEAIVIFTVSNADDHFWLE
jgi:hypothetical protein